MKVTHFQATRIRPSFYERILTISTLSIKLPLVWNSVNVDRKKLNNLGHIDL